MRKKQGRVVPTFTQPLTVEQAKIVSLSWNPVIRLIQLKRYGSYFGLRMTGWSPLPQYMTRASLVRMAKIREDVEKMMHM